MNRSGESKEQVAADLFGRAAQSCLEFAPILTPLTLFIDNEKCPRVGVYKLLQGLAWMVVDVYGKPPNQTRLTMTVVGICEVIGVDPRHGLPGGKSP